MAKKINTVVAKAIITTAANEAYDARKSAAKKYRTELLKSADHEKLISLYGQIDKLQKEARAVRERIEGKCFNEGYIVYANRTGTDLDARQIKYNKENLVAECILLSEAGKTIDQIKEVIRKKLS